MTMRTSSKFLPTMAAFLVATSPAFADVITNLTPTSDLFTSGTTKVDNGNLDIGHFNFGAGVDLRALLIFDLSSIAPGATINSATLTINQVGLPGNQDAFGRANLRRADVAWNPSDSASDLYDAASIANSAFITDFSPPDDYVDGVDYGYSLNVFDTVSAWHAGTSSNHGFVLKQGAEGFGGTGRRFDSFTLTIDYTPIPEPSSALPLATLLGVAILGVRRRRRR